MSLLPKSFISSHVKQIMPCPSPQTQNTALHYVGDLAENIRNKSPSQN
jgi:hypothetical protein